jgi:hypothetical protein
MAALGPSQGPMDSAGILNVRHRGTRSLRTSPLDLVQKKRSDFARYASFVETAFLWCCARGWYVAAQSAATWPKLASRSRRAKAGWEAGSHCRCFWKPQQRQAFLAELARSQGLELFRSFVGFRPFAAVFELIHHNDTRDDTRCERLLAVPQKKPRSVWNPIYGNISDGRGMLTPL